MILIIVDELLIVRLINNDQKFLTPWKCEIKKKPNSNGRHRIDRQSTEKV